MPHEINFSELSTAELLLIAEAGEGGAGYSPFQKASSLLVYRASSEATLLEKAQDPKMWTIELTDEDWGRLSSVLG